MAKESDREPGLIALALHGIKLVGVRGALQTVRYGRWKDRLDRAYLRDRPSGPEVRPGELSAVATVGAATVLTFGDLQLEVVFVADAIVRLTWTPGGLPAPAAVAPGMAERAPLDGVIAHDVNGAQVFTTDTLRVTVATDGSIEIADRGGRDESVPESERWQVVRRERPPVRSGERWTATVDLGPDDQVHGLGERSALFDLRPGTYGLWNTEQSGTYGPEADPLYITIPVAMVVAPGRGHLSFWENSHKGEVVVGEQLTASFDGGALRTYVTAGGPEVALASFSELTGRPELPPRWALGYHQCRWGYKTEADIRAVVAGFREHDLPVSAIHFDIDYMDRYRVFTVDEAAFPDLAGLTADLAADGIQAVTIIDPGVAKAEDFDLYRDGRDNGRFLKLADGAEVNAIVWPGMVGFPDFSDPAVRGWWAGQYPALLDQGVSGIWHDMCEPAVFSATTDASLPLATRHHLEGQGGDHVEGRNLYGQGMAQAGHEGLRRHRPVRRPWLLTRSGWAGIQRFAWTWTGDVATSWTMLHRTLCTTLNLSLSGVPYTGPDVGGFSGDPSPELYTRWFQMSAWLPFFRSHSIFTMPSREPWRAAGPHLDAIREAMAWRYRLIPYLYTLSWWASTRGDPPIVPVWWSGSGEEGTAADPELLAVDDEFLVGPNVLVAPVFGEDAVEREVRLPAGEWHHLAGDGPQEGLLTVPVTMDRIPVFVRAGAVLPTDESGRDVLHVYPPTAGTEPLASSWYRDDGDGYGPHRLEDLTVTSVDAARWTVTRTIDPGSEFPVDDTDLAVLVHGGPWTVSVDGGEAMTARPDQPVRVGDFSEIAVRRRV